MSAVARGRRGTRDAGRDVSRLLADFGHDLPSVPTRQKATKEARLFRRTPGRGPRKAGRGWSPASAPISSWRMTSDQAPVLWPFISTPGLAPTGAQMGIDMLSGGSFYADPQPASEMRAETSRGCWPTSGTTSPRCQSR